LPEGQYISAVMLIFVGRGTEFGDERGEQLQLSMFRSDFWKLSTSRAFKDSSNLYSKRPLVSNGFAFENIYTIFKFFYNHAASRVRSPSYYRVL
jgi:hypothetical protein